LVIQQEKGHAEEDDALGDKDNYKDKSSGESTN